MAYGYMVEHGPLVAHGSWTVYEAQQGCTWRVGRVLESVTSILCGHRGYAGLQIILTLCAY